MKKVLLLLLSLAMLLSLFACIDKKTVEADQPADSNDPATEESLTSEGLDRSEDATGDEFVSKDTEPEKAGTLPEIILNGINTVDGFAEYELVTVYKTNDVAPPKPASVYTHYEAAAGNTYLVVVTDVKNLQNTSVSAGDLLSTSLDIGGNSHSGICIVEEDEGSSFGYSNTTTVAALETARLYYLFEVPENADTENMVFSAEAGKEVRSVTMGLSAFESQTKSFSIGEEITDGETVSATVNEIYFSNTLYPPRPGSYYQYYEAPTGKTYLILKMTAKNLKGTDLKYDAIAGVSCTYNEKYKYSTFACFEQDGGANLNGYSSQYAIAPLDSGILYYLAEVPAEVESGTVEISLYIAGEYYNYTVG